MDMPKEQETQIEVNTPRLRVSDEAMEEILDEVNDELNHLKLRYDFLVTMKNRISTMPFFVSNENPELIKKKIIELSYYADFINEKLRVDWD